MKWYVASIVVCLFCIAAIVIFPHIAGRRLESPGRILNIVEVVRSVKADEVTECILKCRQAHQKRGIEVTLRERADIERVVTELKAMTVDENDVDVRRSDSIILILGENRSLYESQIRIDGIGFSNPPPYISPSLRSPTLGRVALELCRRHRRAEPVRD